MTTTDKIFIAAVILLLDIVFFVIPMATIFAAYILFCRPLWFRDFMLNLYADK
ncbi:MAG: hypothetical protein Q8R76_09365 [Candidatus Omnitrophota bacterium]|nr:hypothetical protein [Candidatus Omnitrophota bacterium]